MSDKLYACVAYLKAGQYIFLGLDKALMITRQFGKWQVREIHQAQDLNTIAQKHRRRPWTIVVDDASVQLTTQPFPKMVGYEITRALRNLAYFNEPDLIAGGGWYGDKHDKELLTLFKIKQGPALTYWLPVLRQQGLYVDKFVPYPCLISSPSKQATYHIEKTFDGAWRHTFMRNGRIELLRYIASSNPSKEQDQEQTLNFIHNEYGVTPAELKITVKDDFTHSDLFERLSGLSSRLLYLVKFKQQEPELENARRMYNGLRFCKWGLFAGLGTMLYMIADYAPSYWEVSALQARIHALPLALQGVSVAESRRLMAASTLKDNPLDLIQRLQTHPLPHLLFNAIVWSKEGQQVTLELSLRLLKPIADQEIQTYLTALFPHAAAIHTVHRSTNEKRYKIIVTEKS
jgi:hypothetical protein